MADDLKERLRDYLGNGGLFNPELMEHDKVRDLIIDMRARIEQLEAERDRLREQRDKYFTVTKWVIDHYGNQDLNHVDFRVDAFVRATESWDCDIQAVTETNDGAL